MQPTPPQPDPAPAGSLRHLAWGVVWLAVLCAVFYAALWHFSGHGAAPLTQRRALTAALFCGVFSLFLGASGVRVTGRAWVAPVLHMLVCLVLLLGEIPWQALLAHANISLFLMGCVGALTGLGGLLMRRRIRRTGGGAHRS